MREIVGLEVRIVCGFVFIDFLKNKDVGAAFAVVLLEELVLGNFILMLFNVCCQASEELS